MPWLWAAVIPVHPSLTSVTSAFKNCTPTTAFYLKEPIAIVRLKSDKFSAVPVVTKLLSIIIEYYLLPLITLLHFWIICISLTLTSYNLKEGL